MDVSAHGKVDEDKDVELDEDGEAEEDGVQDEAGQAQPPVQSPFVQMDTENLQAERRGSVTSQLPPGVGVTVITPYVKVGTEQEPQHQRQPLPVR